MGWQGDYNPSTRWLLENIWLVSPLSSLATAWHGTIDTNNPVTHRLGTLTLYTEREECFRLTTGPSIVKSTTHLISGESRESRLWLLWVSGGYSVTLVSTQQTDIWLACEPELNLTENIWDVIIYARVIVITRWSWTSVVSSGYPHQREFSLRGELSNWLMDRTDLGSKSKISSIFWISEYQEVLY